MNRVAVLGAGSWGTTLGLVLHEKGRNVVLWEYDPGQVEAIRREHENTRFLPGVAVPEAVAVTGDLTEALTGARAVVAAVPSHAMRGVANEARPLVARDALVVNVAKGIENGTLMRMSQVLSETLGRPDSRLIASVVGPSHAEEVSRRLPTVVVAAALEHETAVLARDLFMTPHLRVYTNTDLVGVELAVSLKNVIAIAAGICDGLGYGDNTKGALLTRGLAEITRLGVAMGGRPETFAGLSGMGDLITTCISRHSRNRHVGEQIAEGRALDDILNSMVMVAEGVRTTKSAVELARRHGIEMPIAEQMELVLFRGKDPRTAMGELMMRDPKPETASPPC